MANVEHSTLTGAALHEPKGVAAASANTVYVADGAASGAWSTIGNSSLASAAKAFQAQLLHVRDIQSSGTSGGTFTSGAWRTRTLNTASTNEITGASLSSNQITLPSGTYFIVASAPAYNVGNHLAKLKNVTDGTDTIIGTVENAGNVTSNSAGQTRSWVIGRFTIAAQKVFEIQHICATTQSTDGLGDESSAGVSYCFSEALIWKVA
jgi:hypothetical protein